MGSGEWGVGSGEWGVGSGGWGVERGRGKRNARKLLGLMGCIARGRSEGGRRGMMDRKGGIW